MKDQETFETTNWSLVLSAWDGSELARREKLNTLFAAYMQPLKSYALRFAGSGVEADDLVQGFCEKICERESFGSINRKDGRFRSFLLRSFQNYFIDQHRKRQTQKRGANKTVSLETDLTEPYVAAAEEFDRNWADTVMSLTRRRLEDDYVQACREELYSAIEPYLAGTRDLPGYEEVGEGLGMSRAAVAVAVKRFRERFGKILREEVKRTLAEGESVDEEIRYLLSIIC